LIHYPVPDIDFATAEIKRKTPNHIVWKEMERMVDLGLTKSIGVSNCTVLLLIDMLTYAKYPPVTN
jgi:diketogulonate reductase-like aldo/keto reductase